MPAGPDIPEWADPRELDPLVRAALRGLDARNARRVAGHLVAAGTLVDEDPAAALAHARAARDRASRVAAVREAVGVAAYHAGDYAEAARELRTYRRMSGDPGYRAVLADCERALGRPEVALRLIAEALRETSDPEEVGELRLVEAGVRQDLGEHAAARLLLEGLLGGQPDPASLDADDPDRLRAASAYADLLEAQGEEDRAAQWRSAVDDLEPDVEFTDVAVEDVGPEAAEEPPSGAQHVIEAGDEVEDDSAGVPGPDGDTASGLSFEEEVEAEVAELLGETDASDEPGDDAQH